MTTGILRAHSAPAKARLSARPPVIHVEDGLDWDDNVRAHLRRLQLSNNGLGMSIYPGNTKIEREEAHGLDCWVAAEEWCYEHPADEDEPIINDWLTECGFAHAARNSPDEPASCVLIAASGGISLSVWPSGDGKTWRASVSGPSGRYQWPIPLVVRKDVTRLADTLRLPRE